jgi:lysozyme family protein
MADFNVAIKVVLGHEGGVGTLKGDPGGKTKFGWSAATCKLLKIAQPKTVEEATALYLKYFWNPLYSQIANQDVATKLLDDDVNQGTETGIEHLQAALIHVGHTVEVDGLFGPATLAAVNQAISTLVLEWMRLIQYQSYDQWIKADPVREAQRKGLARRAAWPDQNDVIAKQLMAGTYQPTI